jgi:hypothetical protein
MNLIKELFAIVGFAIIYSVSLYLVRGIVIYKENRFIERRVVRKVSSL